MDESTVNPASVPTHGVGRTFEAIDEEIGRYRARSASDRAQRGGRAALALSSAAAASSIAGAADAVILYSGVQNIELELTRDEINSNYSTGATSTTIDLDFDGSGDARIQALLDYDYFAQGYFRGFGGARIVARERERFGAFAPRIIPFSPGAPVVASPNTTAFALFTDRPYLRGSGDFYGPNPDIAGFTLGNRLGWIRLTFGDGVETISVRIVDWAIESEPGVPINAGAVPEPSTGTLTGLGLLALGARGVRKRRQRTTTASARRVA